MDKAEYRNKLEEINSCAETGAFREAALIADEIDWKHVRSTKTLCMIGEIYEANKRYEDSARILKYAYKRSSSSKTVLYRLAELDIRNGEYDEAKRLINEFEQNSPNDTSRYILRYKLMRALREPLDDQIAVLREYKEHEYTERWAYELAKLYRKNGQREKCIEECDDLILWFMEGRFVTKALELKKQLTELTPAQQAAYEAGLAGEKRQESRAAVTTGSRLTGLENVERAILASSDSDDDEEDVSTFGYVHAAAAALRQKGESGQEAPGVENIQAAQENNNQENNNQDENLQGDRSQGDGPQEDGSPEEESQEEKPQAEKLQEEKPQAAAIMVPDEDWDDDEPVEEEKSGIKAAGAFSRKISDRIRSVLSGLRRSPKEEEEPEETDAKETVPDAGEASQPIDDGEEKPVSWVYEVLSADDGTEDSGKEPAAEEAEEEGTFTFLPQESEEETAKTAAEEEAAASTEETSENVPAAVEAAGAAESSEPSAEKTAEAAENSAPETESTAPEDSGPSSEKDRILDLKDIEADLAIEEAEGPGELDLRDLFDETGSALATEVASGGYVMADTLERDREKAEENAQMARETQGGEAGADAFSIENNLTARETDESLGLTRELHLRDAIAEELSRRESGSGTPIMSPEEAARKAVAQACGMPPESPAVEEGAYSDEELDAISTKDGIPDEELLRIYGSDEGIRSELMVPDEDLPDVPSEDSRESLMNLSSYVGDHEEERNIAEDAALLDAMIREPDIFVTVPVEGRQFTEPEKKAMSYFASIPGVDYQVTSALADIHNNSADRTSRSGNVVITGRQGSGKTRLAQGLILIACMHLGVRAVKEARIVADVFNKKDPAEVVKRMAGGFLIIEAAGSLSRESVHKLNEAMEFDTDDLIVILEDERADMKKLLEQYPDFAAKFTSRITVPVFTNDELVTFARVYAKDEGYKFDDMSTIALYTKIGEKQSAAEPMTVGKVRALVERAIERNSRRFFSRTTDKEDGLIYLTEKDFRF